MRSKRFTVATLFACSAAAQPAATLKPARILNLRAIVETRFPKSIPGVLEVSLTNGRWAVLVRVDSRYPEQPMGVYENQSIIVSGDSQTHYLVTLPGPGNRIIIDAKGKIYLRQSDGHGFLTVQSLQWNGGPKQQVTAEPVPPYATEPVLISGEVGWKSPSEAASHANPKWIVKSTPEIAIITGASSNTITVELPKPRIWQPYQLRDEPFVPSHWAVDGNHVVLIDSRHLMLAFY